MMNRKLMRLAKKRLRVSHKRQLTEPTIPEPIAPEENDKPVHREYSEHGLTRLACAIVESACDDYVYAGLRMAKHQRKAETATGDELGKLLAGIDLEKGRMAECKAFFMSKGFAMLAPKLDPIAVIEALDWKIAKRGHRLHPNKKRWAVNR